MSEVTKIFGINAQIDFGNFAVGIGTLVVAIVTAWSILKNNSVKLTELRKLSDVKIAEFRMKWNYDLRKFVSRYVAIHREISLIKSRSTSGKTSKQDRPLLIELYEIRSSIRMMLKENSEDASENELERLISMEHPSDSTEAKDTREKITIAARQVLKSVWAQAKTEIRN